ncbi:hypothetical protein M0802_015181 [Mischocyttarus mexicanus]|nr:hypothetical protein M0802_015181 [Mischocyttarus mexicanus]
MQKLIYGKRMLRDSARRFVESENGITVNGISNRISIIQGKEFMALVDSGSDLTLLREDKFTEIGSVEFTKTIKRAEGAGNGNIRIIGAFVGEINVDDVVCNIKIHVVPTGAIPNECILGKNVLSNVEVIVRKGKVVKMVQIHEDEEKGKTKRSAEQEDDTRSVDGENAEAVCEEDKNLINNEITTE